MKSKLFLTTSVLIAALVFSSWTYSVLNDKESLLIRLILQGLNQNHYSEVSVDDKFSEDVLEMYIEQLDFNKRYLTKKDVDQLKKYKTKIDDEVKSGSYEMFDLSLSIIQDRYVDAEGFYKEILAKPFDFTANEKINLDSEDMTFAANKSELKERWRKLLKYQTLARLHNLINEQEKEQEKEKVSEDEDKEILSVEQLEEKARNQVKKNYDDTFIRINKLERKDWRTRYINAVAHVFDPHTTYFPPRDRETFDQQISGQFEGIGARLLEQTDGYIKIQEVMPGGPSSRQGLLKANDLILKVGQADAEAVSVVDMRVGDAVKLIRGKKGTEVRLTVRKPDGSEEIIPIIRDVVDIEETFAKSLLLEEEGSRQKIGYIDLPGFYTNFKDRNARTSWRDVAFEIEKLKKEGMTNLVLDLRRNGGGSLPDAIKMTGLFIEEGPVVQVKGRNKNPYVYRDTDPTVQWDGPLIVLVNSQSASASEILAAAIQDYKRGIIMGGKSTYGKGTVQTFIYLDQSLKEYPELQPMGAVKLTTQKFYRINGGATQLKGVTPDIVLPDAFKYLDIGEKEYEYSMPWDEIQPLEYKTWVSTGVYQKRAIDKSKKRIASDPVFSKIEENAKRIKASRDIKNYSLQLETYQAYRKKDKVEADKYKDIYSKVDGLKIYNPKTDLAFIGAEESRTKTNTEWIKAVGKDPYIFEAIQVMKDLK